MKRLLALAVASSLAACAGGSGRVQTLSQAPSFRAKVLAIAAVRGAKGKTPEIAAELARRLAGGGVRAVSLEESDSVVAGSALGLDVAGNPRVLAEIRRATGADAVAFLTLDPGWRSLDVAVLDVATGDPVLRASARPRGDAFASADEVAQAAAEALAALAPERARAASAAREDKGGLEDLPVP